MNQKLESTRPIDATFFPFLDKIIDGKRHSCILLRTISRHGDICAIAGNFLEEGKYDIVSEIFYRNYVG